MPDWDARTAEWYAEKYGEYATNRLGIDSLEGLAPSAVLDIGCGTGAALRHASLRWPAARFVGVDPVPRMIEIARDCLIGHVGEGAIEFRLGSAEGIPASDSEFDLVLAFDSVDHWLDPKAGAREVARVLAKKGHVAIVKDQGVPGAAADVVALLQGEAGVELVGSKQIDADGVSFAIWIFRAP